MLLKGIILRVRLGGADKFLGLIFGFLEGIAVISLILFLLGIQPLFDSSVILANSFFANLLLPLITGIHPSFNPSVTFIFGYNTGTEILTGV
jgi:membrane protein required for colicin V production